MGALCEIINLFFEDTNSSSVSEKKLKSRIFSISDELFVGITLSKKNRGTMGEVRKRKPSGEEKAPKNGTPAPQVIHKGYDLIWVRTCPYPTIFTGI